MLATSDDDYEEDYLERKFVKIPEHMMPKMNILSRELQQLLSQEPSKALNLCVLAEKYELYFNRPFDKLGYGKLVDCIEAVPGPIILDKLGLHGACVRLTGPPIELCKFWQKSKSCFYGESCRNVAGHQCSRCGSPKHGLANCQIAE